MVDGRRQVVSCCICYPASSQAVDSIEQVRNSHLSAADPSSRMVDVRRQMVSRCRMVDGIEQVRNSHLSAADPSSQMVDVRRQMVSSKSGTPTKKIIYIICKYIIVILYFVYFLYFLFLANIQLKFYSNLLLFLFLWLKIKHLFC